ncbi:hypothetical protein [Streptomyces albicerus]|uniref:hypothetical protein n=1 Tax=Streptomyces albicerus TaxID=2569859 RepID=UPI00124B8810|nr:hypothetical protein [Streptomyces albicerus]
MAEPGPAAGRAAHEHAAASDTIVEGFAAVGYHRRCGRGALVLLRPLPRPARRLPALGPTGNDTDRFAERRSGDFAPGHVEKPAREVAGAERAFLFVNAAETHAPCTRGTGDAYDAETQRIVRAWSGSWNGGEVVPSAATARQDMARLHEAQRIALEDVDREPGLLLDALRVLRWSSCAPATVRRSARTAGEDMISRSPR